MKGSRALAAAGWATIAFLYVPLFAVAVFSFNDSRYAAGWHGFTLDWYAKLFANAKILDSTKNSIFVAAVSCLVAVPVGTAAAIAQSRSGRKSAAAGLFSLPLLVPELMMAVGFLLFFGLLRWDLGLPTLYIAHATFNIPIVWLLVAARLRRIDPRLEDAAVDLGATRWQALRRVTLPLLMPAVWAGALIAFVDSLNCFVVSFFVAGPNATTLPIQVYSMLKFSLSPEVNALATLMFAASLALVGAAWFLQGGEDLHAA